MKDVLLTCLNRFNLHIMDDGMYTIKLSESRL